DRAGSCVKTDIGAVVGIGGALEVIAVDGRAAAGREPDAGAVVVDVVAGDRRSAAGDIDADDVAVNRSVIAGDRDIGAVAGFLFDEDAGVGIGDVFVVDEAGRDVGRAETEER